MNHLDRTRQKPEERKILFGRERTRQVRGLVLLALVALLFAITRAGAHRIFGPGWWRLW